MEIGYGRYLDCYEELMLDLIQTRPDLTKPIIEKEISKIALNSVVSHRAMIRYCVRISRKGEKMPWE